jgi:hypothetical protein
VILLSLNSRLVVISHNSPYMMFKADFSQGGSNFYVGMI